MSFKLGKIELRFKKVNLQHISWKCYFDEIIKKCNTIKSKPMNY